MHACPFFAFYLTDRSQLMRTIHHQKKMAFGMAIVSYIFLSLIPIGVSSCSLIQGSASVTYEHTDSVLMPSNLSISFSRSCEYGQNSKFCKVLLVEY